MKELEWVEFLKHKAKQNKELLAGIGDDCALVKIGREKVLLKSDLFIEGIHFQRKNTSFKIIGQRAVLRVLSDFAACAGTPKFIGISIGITKDIQLKELKEILKGVLKVAKKYRFSLAGGDTCRANKLFLDVWGVGTTDKFIARHTAKIGDYIFVTSRLGQRAFNKIFTPRLREAKMLATNHKINSMIDISDGFILDLYRILKASKKGAIVEKNNIPTTRGIEDIYRGEDYELIFTVSQKDKNIDYLKKKFYCLGRVTPEKYGYRMKEKNGYRQIKVKGYCHF
ncbi:MAG: thiamine-monophosphate kinase [Candidatus Omnitrophica bacterium]|jgi:thiamine-monophosphate kinase|nr:thiamine-monophosphate kinase [Candidatus Omnitrophota bacterium]